MKKIIALTVAIISIATAGKINNTIKDDIVKTMDKKIENIYKMLEEAKNAKIRGDLIDEQIDTTKLPIMQGVYTIRKDGKLVKREISAKDNGGTFYYLNKKNNIIIKKIGQDFVLYKIRQTKTKTALAYPSLTTSKDSTKEAQINKFSSVRTKPRGAIATPTLDQVIRNLKKNK